ncbi:hypothetical protein SAMN04487948_105210 [Halogranum amylolyticum]|uniref:Uncharacterized protein n=1 Tax=Halogranum amylolyticum TaxID=660520 RepID=A0A1H8SP50_9EURY|nr:hypothetical protein [Halogranum amylolyticum]SEO79943.1 hypothetical protein SAMN04487948_105210 [Halogranum amylolyticum]
MQDVAVTARSRVPPIARAFLRYVGRSPDPGVVPVLLLRSEVDADIDAMTERMFSDVEVELERALAAGEIETVDVGTAVRFDYDTRLVLPALLTLGRLCLLANDVPLLRHVRDVDEELARESRTTTYNIVQALVDGDMRDAINDEEYEDFETNARPKSRVAARAQERLSENVSCWFESPDTPAAVREHYEHAVGLSEGHQDDDERFRDLLERYHAAEGEDRSTIADEIRDSYKFAESADTLELFDDDQSLPYFLTQYLRVGILYEDMLNMYEADLDVDLGHEFKRAIVLMVIAAQVGLDDTDDYPEDRRTQLTPVTAELNLAADQETGVANLRDVVVEYLDRAEACSPDHLTSMAIEFIRQQSLDRLAALPTSE